MANRVTATEVRAIMLDIDSSFSDADIDVFIGSANILVTNEVASAGTLTDAHLKEIERWLSAHLVASADPRPTEEAAGVGASVKIKYQSKIGFGLNLTHYGQQVLILDTTGGLSKLGRENASIYTIKPDLWD